MWTKRLITISAVIFSMMLCGCGKKEIVSIEELEEAIRQELDTTYDYIRTFSYEVKKEKKKGKNNNVDLDIEAVGKYATFFIEGTLSFTKGDSAWEYVGGKLEKSSYSLKDYPELEYFYPQIVADITESGSESDFSPVSLTKQDGVVYVTVSRKMDSYPCSYVRDYVRGFEYEPFSEEWILEDDYNSSSSHDPVLEDIEGTYYFESDYLLTASGDFRIYDCSDESFTITYPGSSGPLVFCFTSSGEFISEIDEKHYKCIDFAKESDNACEIRLWRYTRNEVGASGSCEGTVLITE